MKHAERDSFYDVFKKRIVRAVKFDVSIVMLSALQVLPKFSIWPTLQTCLTFT